MVHQCQHCYYCLLWYNLLEYFYILKFCTTKQSINCYNRGKCWNCIVNIQNKDIKHVCLKKLRHVETWTDLLLKFHKLFEICLKAASTFFNWFSTTCYIITPLRHYALNYEDVNIFFSSTNILNNCLCHLSNEMPNIHFQKSWILNFLNIHLN